MVVADICARNLALGEESGDMIRNLTIFKVRQKAISALTYVRKRRLLIDYDCGSLG